MVGICKHINFALQQFKLYFVLTVNLTVCTYFLLNTYQNIHMLNFNIICQHLLLLDFLTPSSLSRPVFLSSSSGSGFRLDLVFLFPSSTFLEDGLSFSGERSSFFRFPEKSNLKKYIHKKNKSTTF